MEVRIESSWKNALAGEFGKPYFESLVRFLHQEKAQGPQQAKAGSYGNFTAHGSRSGKRLPGLVQTMPRCEDPESYYETPEW